MSDQEPRTDSLKIRLSKIRGHLNNLLVQFRIFKHHLLILFGYWKLFVGLGLVSFIAGYYLHYSYTVKNATRVVETPPPPKKTEQPYPYLIPPDSSLSEVLKGMGVNAKTIQQLVRAAKPVFDLGRLQAGTRFRLIHLTDPSSDLVGIEFQITPVELIQVNKTGGVWSARRIVETVETKVVTFSGLVKSNLWESAEHARMDTDLIIQLADIFAWQIDFAREVRLGDRWRISVEQKLANGKPVGWGSILAAEYQNGKQSYDAILFKLSDGNSAYFAEDGSSLRKMFLKSPIRYAHITSRFQSERFHPVLKVNRPHLGVDYGAPRGTPVRAVGDGVVTFAGWHGEGGNTLKIKHNAKYQTAYLHLSRFEKGIRSGTHVKQGQTIAFVGATGMATGTHLHFEFHVNGKVVDPLSVKFPPADPVPSDRLSEFKALAESSLRGLPPWEKKL
jgi:murein DD-endopeptidase MepM/ murein hydrolase activator NlpD